MSVNEIVEAEGTNRLTAGRMSKHMYIGGESVQGFISKMKKEGHNLNVILEKPDYYYRKCKTYNINEVVALAEKLDYKIEFTINTHRRIKEDSKELTKLKSKRQKILNEIEKIRNENKSLLLKKEITGKILKRTGQSFAEKQDIKRAAVPLESNSNIGVYFLMKSDERYDGKITNREIVYIGQSVDVSSRIRAHSQEGYKQFDSYSYVVCEKEHLDLLESLYIHVYKPEYNGRPPKNLNSIAKILIDNESDINEYVDTLN